MDLRKLDALVAKKVMGLEMGRTILVDGCNLNYVVAESGQIPLPSYSSSITAAWEVIDVLRANLKTTRHHSNETFTVELRLVCKDFSMGSIVEATGPSVPVSICLAALKAVGVDVSEWEK